MRVGAYGCAHCGLCFGTQHVLVLQSKGSVSGVMVTKGVARVLQPKCSADGSYARRQHAVVPLCVPESSC